MEMNDQRSESAPRSDHFPEAKKKAEMPAVLNDELCERAARAHDREAAAQCGEPDPWTPEYVDDAFRQERIAAMRAAFDAIASMLGVPASGNARSCPFCGWAGPFDVWPCAWLDGSGANVVRCPNCHGAAPAKTWNRMRAALVMNVPQPSVIDEVSAERKRQDAQWGGPDHDDEHATEDFVRFIGRQAEKCDFGRGPNARERLVKIGALAVAAVESYDRCMRDYGSVDEEARPSVEAS